jgi:hypothetical protein
MHERHFTIPLRQINPFDHRRLAGPAVEFHRKVPVVRRMVPRGDAGDSQSWTLISKGRHRMVRRKVPHGDAGGPQGWPSIAQGEAQ